MNTSNRSYHVHAELVGSERNDKTLDDAKAGHPLERRLNRLERVAMAYRGQVENRLSNGLQIVFETADAALLGACEMQHRCAVVPQVHGRKVALRIGMHQGLVKRRSKDSADDARELASQLAVADDGIVASGLFVAALNPELHKLTTSLKHLPAPLDAHRVDWRRVIPSEAQGDDSIFPASKYFQPIGPYLRLHHELRTFEVTSDHPVLTIGREPLNDLALTDAYISRHHCRIERSNGRIVLTDASSNGTYVMPDKGQVLRLRNESVVISRTGMLFFGRPCNGERRGGIRYEVF